MCVFSRQISAVRGAEPSRLADLRLDLVEVHEAVLVVADLSQVDAGDARGAAELRLHDVRQVARDGLVAAAAVGQQRDQVRHGAGSDVERSFLAHAFCRHRLQALDRGVVAQDVVTDLGVRHRLAHRGRGVGHGVGAQVDGALAVLNSAAYLAAFGRALLRAPP